MLKTEIKCEECHKVLIVPLGNIIEAYIECRQDDCDDCDDCVPGFLCEQCASKTVLE